MKTTDFSPALSSTQLAENLQKQFGTRVNLNKYDREQLEDIRNKLRTRIFQQEGSAGVNDLLTNETYQKDKAMLELLNIRIKEMLGEDIKKLRDKMNQLSEAKKAKPDFLDMDKDGNKKEPMKKAIADKKVKEGGFKGMDTDRKEKAYAAKQTMKHVKNPTAGEKAAAKDIKPGSYADRAAMLKSAEADGRLKNEGFPTVASARAEHEKNKTTDKFDKTTRSTGDVYTRKTDQLAKGTEDPRRAATTMKSKKTGKAIAESTPSCGHTKAVKGCKECSAMKEALKGKQSKLDADKDGKLEKSDFAKLRAKKKVKESLNAFKHNVKFVNESIGYYLSEDEEGKAKAITAAGDMVNDFTSWMQRVGQYQTKAIIELSDEIRAEFGPAQAEAFKQAVGPALSSTLEVLTSQREAISNAVASLATGEAPAPGMGMEPEIGPGTADMAEPGMDMTEPDAMNPEAGIDDEFGASDAAAGGASTSGREMRESKFARKLQESHSIMSKLAS
jgi:hypothetical protein